MIASCRLPAVSTSHLPLNKTGTNSSPYLWDHRPVQTISRDYINLVSGSPYYFAAVLCSVHYQEDLRPHTNTTTCAPQCLNNLVRCMSTLRKQVLQTCLLLCKRKCSRSITEIKCFVIFSALSEVSQASSQFTLRSILPT